MLEHLLGIEKFEAKMFDINLKINFEKLTELNRIFNLKNEVLDLKML